MPGINFMRLQSVTVNIAPLAFKKSKSTAFRRDAKFAKEDAEVKIKLSKHHTQDYYSTAAVGLNPEVQPYSAPKI